MYVACKFITAVIYTSPEFDAKALAHLMCIYKYTVLAGCNAERIRIDDVTVSEQTTSIEFSSDPNAKFRCRLNHGRNRRFKKCAGYQAIIAVCIKLL